MIRARFTLDIEHEDYRPLKWPIQYPYWCSGYSVRGTLDEPIVRPILIAYAQDEAQILELWPEAKDIASTTEERIIFTDRFPRPDWYHPVLEQAQVAQQHVSEEAEGEQHRQDHE